MSRAWWAYVLHLCIPAWLAVDATFLYRKGSGSLTAWQFTLDDEHVLEVAGTWLLAGVILLVRTHRQRFSTLVVKPLVAFYTICLVLVCAELTLRLLEPPGPRPMLYRPGGHRLHRNNPANTPGLGGIARFSADNVGVRGADLDWQARRCRIVAVGGSTTQCVDLDDRDAWPQVLMETINKQLAEPSPRVWVGNAGVNGHTAAHHLWMIRSLPLLARSDALIFLVGVNDLQEAIGHNGQSTHDLLDDDAQAFCANRLAFAAHKRPYYHRLELYELMRNSRLASRPPRFDSYARARAHRASSSRVPMPPLEVGLDEYKTRILAIAEECHKNQQRCIFLTQPTIWRQNLAESEQHLLWLGWVGAETNEQAGAFVSVEDLARGMQRYNQQLLEVCRSAALECYDLASAIPKDRSAFVDDCHYNVAGSHMVADFVARKLLEHPQQLQARY